MEIIEEPITPERSDLARARDALLVDAFGDDTDDVPEGLRPPDPMVRFLIRDDTGAVIGHAALHLRSVLFGEDACTIGMIGDVAIAKGFRRQGLCRRLIETCHARLVRERVDFSVLFAYVPEVYRSSGYVLMKNETHFLDHDGLWKTFVYRGSMYCELSDRRWPNRKLHLQGPTV